MVALDSYQKLTRLLELYLLKQAGDSVPIPGYVLIAFIPVDPNSWVNRQTLLLSLPEVRETSQRAILRSLFVLLKQGLSEEDYLEIYNIDLIEANSFPVQRLNAWQPQRMDGIFSVPINLIGEVTAQTVTVIRSSILGKLTYYTPLRVELVDGDRFTGKLASIQYSEHDAQLDFETELGVRSCNYTTIVQVQSYTRREVSCE